MFAATAESAGAPPSDLDPALAAVLEKEGVRVKDGDQTLMEVWFVTSAPSGDNFAGANVTITDIPHGALLAVIRYPERGQDRRGQTIKPGIYTGRLSFFPPDGNHQGVAPQRDFLLLSLASEDKDPKAAPDYEALVSMSTNAAGTPHPLVLSTWKGDPSTFEVGLKEEGEDWVLRHKIGERQVALIVKGVYAH
jgi:hypothetical protein